MDVKSVRTDDRKLLMLISWTHLLDRLESGDRHSGAEIQQLRGLAKWMDDQEEFPPLRLEELAPETPRRLRGLWRLVNDAIERAKDPGTAHAGFVERIGPVGYGQWTLRFTKGAATSWADARFGIDFDRWAQGKYPHTPVWLDFSQFGGPVAREQWPKTRRALEEWLGRKDPPECFHEGDRILVPVELESGVGYDVVLNAVAKRLRDVACRIAPEGRTEAQG